MTGRKFEFDRPLKPGESKQSGRAYKSPPAPPLTKILDQYWDQNGWFLTEQDAITALRRVRRKTFEKMTDEEMHYDAMRLIEAYCEHR